MPRIKDAAGYIFDMDGTIALGDAKSGGHRALPHAIAVLEALKAKGTALGDVKVGSTWVLPPTLTVQYHFMPKEKFSPYLGAGLNYTMFYNTKAAAGLGSLKLSNNVGYALQAGVDYALTDKVYLNVDVKQIFLSTDAKINGGAVRAKTALNPLVVGVGVGYKF